MGQWKGIEEFIAVVESGSFSRAAERLGVTASQISKRVAELEKRLQARLLERSTRAVCLTTQGNVFYRACRKLVADFGHACDSVHLDKESLTGVMKLCYVGGSRPAFQMDLYRAFLDKYPGLSMEVTYRDHVPNLTQEGLDLAVVLGEIDSNAPSFHLCWIDCALVASPTLFTDSSLPATPADLSSLPCVLNGEDHWRLTNGDTSVRVPVSGRFSSLNMPACIDACLSGLGVFMIPTYTIDGMVSDGRLVRILPGWHIRKSLYAMIPSNDYVPVKVILLMEFLEQAMGMDADVAGQLRQMLLKTTSSPMSLLRDVHEGIREADTRFKQHL
ncbi:MAG TPA: LysR family transcriptional regulator [Pseudomonadales bacterium]|nr:LysR family transcriptional regulator [Pseudomonadales bacterium]